MKRCLTRMSFKSNLDLEPKWSSHTFCTSTWWTKHLSQVSKKSFTDETQAKTFDLQVWPWLKGKRMDDERKKWCALYTHCHPFTYQVFCTLLKKLLKDKRQTYNPLHCSSVNTSRGLKTKLESFVRNWNPWRMVSQSDALPLGQPGNNLKGILNGEL